MTRGIVYYTNGKCDPVILDACRRQIDRAAPDLSVVNVSLTPLPWRTNIVLPLEPSIPTMFKQQLAGLQAIDTDVVFFCEHDVLYHPSHFTFTPPRENVYYFNFLAGGVVKAVDAYTHCHHIDLWYVTEEVFPSAFWVKP